MRIRPSLVAVAAAAALALAACGSSAGSTSTPSAAAPTASATPTPFAGRSAAQILAATQAAAKRATAVKVSGTLVDSGQSMSLQMAIGRGGTADGTITMKEGSLKVRRLGTTFYLQGDKQFWTSNGAAQVATLFKNKWIKMPAGRKDFADFEAFTSLDKFVDGVLTPDSTLTRVPGRTIGGVATVGLSDAGPGAKPDESGTLYVAATGTPYPLLLDSTDHTNSISFTGWDEPLRITAPAAAEVVDIARLGG